MDADVTTALSALKTNSDSPEALAALTRAVQTLGEQQKWDEAVEAYEAALKTARRGTGEQTLLLALGTLLWKQQAKLDQAEGVFRRARKNDPRAPEVLEFYTAYHTQRNEIPVLLNLLTQALRAEPDEAAQTNLSVTMAKLAETEPRTIEKAIDIWKGLLRKNPKTPDAFESLHRLYHKAEKWNALNELLKERLDQLPETAVEEKVALYQEMIPIYRDRMKLEPMVQNTYLAIRNLKPDHIPTLDALIELFERKSRWADLVDVLASRAQVAPTPQEKIALHRRVAALWADKLGKPQNAAAAYEHILAIEPDDGDTLAALTELYTKGRKWQPLIDLNRRQLAGLPPAEQRQRLIDMAKVAAERLNDEAQAVAIWGEVLANNKADAEALGALAALHEKAKDWAALNVVLGQQAELATDDATLAALLERRGTLLAEKLNDPSAAALDLVKVHELQPDNQRVFRTLRDLYSKANDFAALEALYAGRGQWSELCDVMTELAEQVTDEKSAIALRERVATLAIEKLNQPERAIKAYERIVAVDPDNRAASDALAGLYRNTAKWSRLLETFEQQLAGLASPEGGAEAAPAQGKRKKNKGDKATGAPAVQEQLQVMAEARKVCEEHLGSKPLAFKWGQRALELAPNDEALFAEVERLGREAEEWEPLFELYARKLKQVTDDAARTTLLRKSLHIAANKTKRAAEAKRLAEALLELVPGDDEAQSALQQQLAAEEKWPEVAALMHRRQTQLTVPSARADLLVAAARIEEEKLNQAETAASSLREALEVDPGNAKVLVALARVCEHRGDHAGLAAVLAAQAKAANDNGERLSLLLRLGNLQEHQVKDAAGARATYQAALDINPEAAEAISGLERAFDDDLLPADEVFPISKHLARFYETTERYDRWAEVLQRLAGVSKEKPEKLRHLQLLVDIYEGPASDKASAYGAALQIFEIEPTDDTNLQRLLRLATETGKLDDLLAAIYRVLEKTSDAQLRGELLMHVAELEEKHPGHEAKAEKAYRELLSIDADNERAVASLTRLLRETERWADLRNLLDLRAERLLDVQEKLALYAQISEIDETLLGDREHAVGVLTKQLELEPNNLKTYHGLERLLTALGRWNQLSDLLAREVDLVPQAEREAIVLRRVDVLAEKIGNFDDAMDVLGEMLKANPEHDDARRAVERMLRKPKAKQRAANILGPLYNKAGNWEGLVEVLQIRRASLTGPKAVAALAKVAEIQETKLADEASALATWQTVLDMEPGNREALAAVERLASMLERPSALVELYLEMATKKSADDVRGQVENLTRAARLCVSSLGDRARAAQIWQQVLDLDPASQEVGRPAAEALEALYPQIGDYARLVEILHVKLDWEDRPSVKSELLVRIADLYDKALGKTEEAVDCLRQAFEATPEDPKLLDRIEPVFESRGQWRDLIFVLERRMALAVGNKARRKLRWRIADIQENKLGDLDEAIATVSANLDEVGGEKQALDALERLYEKKEAHGSRLEVLERRLVLTEAPEERVSYLRRAAALLAGPLEQQADALEKWREILRYAPSDAPTLEAIEELLDSEDFGLRRAAGETMEPVYESQQAFPKLARVLEIFIATEDDRRERMKVWIRLAALRRDQLDDQLGALQAFGEAIKESLGEDHLMDLLVTYERLADQLAKQGDVVKLYQEIEPDILREDVKLRIVRRLATAALDAGDLDSAAERYLGILDQSPDDMEAMSGLEAIYRKKGDDERLYELILRRAELAMDSSGAELPLRVEAGALALKLDRAEDAITAYERALQLAPQNREVIGALEKLYHQTERWVDLRELLERRLGAKVSPNEAIEIHERIARIEIDELGNYVAAVDHLKEIFKRDPDHAAAIEMAEALVKEPETVMDAAGLLEAVYAKRNAWDRLVAIDEARRDVLDEPAARVVYTRRIARIYEENVEDLGKAFEWYGKLFTEVPAERPVQEQLLRLAPKLDKWRDLANLLDDYLYDEMSESPEVLAIVKLAAEVWDMRLGDQDAAKKHYRRYLDAQPGEPKAVALYEQALERWQQWGDLLDLIEEEIARANSVGERVALLKRSARICETKLQDNDRAARTLRSVLDESPPDSAAADDLERLYRADERWSDLADHLLWRLDVQTDPAAKREVQLRLAALQGAELNNVESAIELYGQVLATDPRNAAARQALEARLPDKSLRLQVAMQLEPSYREMQAWDKLVHVLEIRLQDGDDPGERLVLLQETAALEERLGHSDKALEARGKVWLEDVANDGALAALEAAVPMSRAFARFVELLTEGAESALDPELQGHLLGKAAMVLETHVGDRGRAIQTWRKALDAYPENEAAFVTLERLLELEGQNVELQEVLQKHAEATNDNNARLALFKRVARLAEAEAGAGAKAISAWTQVLDISEADDEALAALAKLYTAANKWPNLAEILQRQVDASSDAQTLRGLRFTLARVFDERLKEPSEAAAQLRLVLDENAGDAQALELLDKLYTREGQHSELLEVLDLRAQTSAAAEADGFAFRAAQLLHKEMGDLHGAVPRYSQILERSPAFKPAREALWALTKDEDARPYAVAALEPLLRAQNAHGELIDLLEIKAAAESAPAGRVPVLAEIARIEEQVRNDLVKALAAWIRAFKEDPADENVRANLERVAQARSDFGRLAKLYEEQIDEVYDTELQRTLALRLADLYEQSLRDPDKAIAALRKSLDLGGGDELATLGRMEALLRQRAKWPELADVLQKRADAAMDPESQAQALVALGQVRLERLSERRLAFEAFRDALERVPTSSEALSALRNLMRQEELRSDIIDVLEPLAESRGDYAELLSLYEYKAALSNDDAQASAWWRRVGEVAENNIKDGARALAGYGKALALESDNAQLADDVARVAQATGQMAPGARLIEAAAAKAEGSAMVELAVRAAGLFERAGDASSLTAAESLYKKVLVQDAENAHALGALEALYRGRGDRAALARTLEQRAQVEMDPTQKVAWLAEAAGLHEQRGDIKATIAAWEEARRADDTNADALHALARLYEREQRHTDLVAILEEQAVAAMDPAVRSALNVRIGQLREQVLHDDDAAASAYREALDADPRSDVAMNALAALEERRGDFSALEEVLLQRLGASDEAEQKALLYRLADNARLKLEDEDRAFGYLRQIMDLDPNDARAFEGIERVLTSSERWHDLIELYETKAQAAKAGKQNAEERRLRLRVAELWAEKLDSPDSACESVEALLKDNPNDVATLITLGGLYERALRYDEALQTLRKAEAAGPRGKEAADLRFRMGRLMQAQDADEESVREAFMQALQADVTHKEALMAVESMARKGGRHEELVQVLELREQNTQDAGERLALLKEIVELYRNQLQRPADGLPALEKLNKLAPDDLEVKEAYGQALIATGDAKQGEALLESLIEGLTAKRQMKAVARLRATLGLAAEARGEVAKALAHLEAAQALDSSSPRVAVALGRLAEAAGDRTKAFKYYRNLLLLSFDEAAAGMTKAGVYLALARLHVAENEAVKARGMVDRGLGIAPNDPDLRALGEQLKRA
ncbi:MAG: hypothetical protein SF187_18910 [Deltaproteobacteria bacterium]|nr:hypothetical protein [Deltaproteobacteria bacterium]